MLFRQARKLVISTASFSKKIIAWPGNPLLWDVFVCKHGVVFLGRNAVAF